MPTMARCVKETNRTDVMRTVRRAGEHQEAVRDALAEQAAGRPLGVGVLWVMVAGQLRELCDVGRGDGVAGGDEALADREVLERARK